MTAPPRARPCWGSGATIWLEEVQRALCPHCGREVDTVASGYRGPYRSVRSHPETLTGELDGGQPLGQ
ncbi:hypothetical protein [Tsukamurella hominis]|uniref:hypothetical protein n=1 Tax=Tsukamurella hominis TaxID=1970232 RepID=UPI0039EB45A4